MKSIDLKVFAWEEKDGQVKEKDFLIPSPFTQATLQYSVETDGFIKGQLGPEHFC